MQKAKKQVTHSHKINNLHSLLEATSTAQKKDIADYASGYLNPNKLVKLPHGETDTHTSWASSLSDHKLDQTLENQNAVSARSRKRADSILKNQITVLKNALLDFSAGTIGALPTSKPKDKVRKGKSKRKVESRGILKGTKAEMKLEALVLSEIEKLSIEEGSSSQEKTDRVQTQSLSVLPGTPTRPKQKYILPFNPQQHAVLPEEIRLPELALYAVNESARLPPSLRVRHPQHLENKIAKEMVYDVTNTKFFTTHLAGITRRDQFNKMVDFQGNVLNKSEASGKKCDGRKAVEHLEQKLVRNLLELEDYDAFVDDVNFERLQVYNEVWNDLCIDSSIFGNLFSEIKSEYDSYLSYLLSSMISSKQSQLLSSLQSKDLSLVSQCDDLEKELEDLEKDAKQSLLHNQTLHRRIAEEKMLLEKVRRLKQQEEEDNRRRMIPLPRKASPKKNKPSEDGASPKHGTEQRLTKSRSEIWLRLDEIVERQESLKTEYVPKSVYRNLLHAVKDTESEMQRLNQQNEYLEKNMAVQENLIRYGFQSCNANMEYLTAIFEK